MQNQFKLMVATGLSFLLFSCTEDRIFEKPDPIPGDTTALVSAPVRINEIVAKGSALTTDLGNNSDWIELYNTSSSPFEMKQGEWYITDSPADSEKFELPQRTLSPGDFLIIFCDDSNRVSGQIHTNFGLSSGGDYVFLYRKQNGAITLTDSTKYGVQAFDNMSVARSPNGNGPWQSPVTPTPGELNP